MNRARKICSAALLAIALSALTSGCAGAIPPIEMGYGMSFGEGRRDNRFRMGFSPTGVVHDGHRLPVDVTLGSEYAWGGERDDAWGMYLNGAGTLWMPDEPNSAVPRLRLGGELFWIFGSEGGPGFGLTMRVDFTGFAHYGDWKHTGVRSQDGNGAWGEISGGTRFGAFADPRTGLSFRTDVLLRTPAWAGAIGMEYVPDGI